MSDDADAALEGRDEQASPAIEPPLGHVLVEISNQIVHAHKEFYGKGPVKARTHVFANCVVCVLEGGYHSSERTLEAHGRGDAVTAQRARLQEILAERFIAIVENALKRRVRSFMSANDPGEELQVEVFVLEPARGQEPVVGGSERGEAT